MRSSVLYAGFTIGVCTFGVWLVLTLRHDRAQRVAWVEASHERTRAHRRATLAARYIPDEVVTATPVARAGSFCRVPGNVAHTKEGESLICTATANGRPRWRKARVHAA